MDPRTLEQNRAIKLQELNEVIQSNPHPEYFLQRAMLYDEMKLYGNVRNDLENGIFHVNSAPDKYPPKLIWDLYYKNGINYKIMHNYAFAIPCLNAALTIDKIIIPDKIRAQCLANIGICHQMRGDNQIAYNHFLQARICDPSHGWYDFLIGTTMPNEYNLALSYFNNAIIKQYSSANLYYHIAVIYFKKQEMELALQNFQTAIQIDPGHENALLMIHRINKKQEFDKVYLDSKKKLENDPLNQNALFKIGNIYYEEDNFQKAYEYYDEILTINPYNEDALLMMGHIYYNVVNFENAREYYQKILAINPSNQNALLMMGHIHYEKNEFQNAMEYYQQILAINPSNQNALLMMGHIYYEKDHFQKAMEYYQQILAINPSDQNALLMMGHIHFFTKQFNTAHQYYYQISRINPSNQDAEKYKNLCLQFLNPQSNQNLTIVENRLRHSIFNPPQTQAHLTFTKPLFKR